MMLSFVASLTQNNFLRDPRYHPSRERRKRGSGRYVRGGAAAAGPGSRGQLGSLEWPGRAAPEEEEAALCQAPSLPASVLSVTSGLHPVFSRVCNLCPGAVEPADGTGPTPAGRDVPPNRRRFRPLRPGSRTWAVFVGNGDSAYTLKFGV